MTRFCFVLTTFILLISCRPDSKSSVNKASAALDVKSLQAPVPYSGNWLSEDYLNKINQHQSPRKAQEGSEDCYIHIPGITLVPTFMAYNFHETGPDLVTIKDNEQYQLWEKQADSLIKKVYTIEVLSLDKIKLGDKVFVKIHSDSQNKEPRILEEILFKGKYTTKEGSPVEFKNNGEISGLENYKYYSPVLDYFDAGLQIDQVGLGMTKEKLDYFGFKFSNDGLTLYKIKCVTYDDAEKRCVEVDFGEKVYILKRK